MEAEELVVARRAAATVAYLHDEQQLGLMQVFILRVASAKSQCCPRQLWALKQALRGNVCAFCSEFALLFEDLHVACSNSHSHHFLSSPVAQRL